MVPPRRVEKRSLKGRRSWNIASTRLNQNTRRTEQNLALVVEDLIGIDIPQNHQPPRSILPPETLLHLGSERHFLAQSILLRDSTLVGLDLLVRGHQLGPSRVLRKGEAVQRTGHIACASCRGR